MHKVLENLSAEMEKEYLLGILENIAEGVLVIDPAGTVLGCNAKAEDIFLYPRDEMIGQNVKMLMPEPFHSQHDGYLQHYHDTGEKRIIGIGREVVGLRKSCEQFPLGLAVSEVKLDGIHHFIGIVRDMTNRRIVETHLLEAKKAALKASEAKSAFLASMSHELRTPLNSIIGFSGILASGMAGEMNEEQHKQISIIQSSGQHLLGLINDILDLSKIDAGKMNMEPKPFSLSVAVDAVLAIVAPLADKKGLKLSRQVDDVELFQDETKFRQLLLNLLSNAVKFTDSGEVKIRNRMDDGRVCIMVSDSGMGIAREDLPHVFDEFRQVGKKFAEAGTGLGLALCQRIIAMMGGDIAVDSEAGKGSCFTLHFPQRFSPGAADAVASGCVLPDGFQADQPSVLAIDDDAGMLELIRQYLKGSGFQCILAGNGAAGLEAAELYHPDVILLDIIMPDMNGWEVLSALKCSEATVTIPVVCISILDDRETAHAMGASQLFTKPVLREQLLDTISTLAGH